MAKITKFDKSNLATVRADINALLAAYSKKSGIELNIGNISFSEGEFTTKLNAKLPNVKTIDDVILESRVKALGLKTTSKCGKKLVGYNTRAKAYPFVFENNGKKYKCSTEQAKFYFSA